MVTKHLIIIFLLGLTACVQKRQQVEQITIETDTTNKYFHKNAIIGNISTNYPKGIKGKEAALFAIKKLETRGINNIQICVVTWIAAPLGGYLVDAKGTWKHKGREFSVFRIGIRDGSDERENKFLAGEEFVFIAMGEDKSNKIWYPSPGPDYEIKEGEVMPIDLLAYEFLPDKKEFENLPLRFK